MASSKRSSPLYSPNGAALITTMLIVVLVVALIMMALSISQTESNLASTNRRTAQSFHAAEGGVGITVPVIQDTILQNAVPASYPATVQVDAGTAGGNTALRDFLEEVTGTSIADTAAATPDLTITALSGQTVQVDVDYEGPANLPGSELEEFAIQYHKKVGGVGCASGTLYYIDSIASDAMQTQSNVGAAYFNCS